LVLTFVCGGVCIHEAKQFANAVSSERTTTAYNVEIQRDYHRLEYYFYKSYSCSYSYSVDGVSYSGRESFPRLGADDATNEKFSNSAGVLSGSDLTVHYDAANPSMNSLVEFGETSMGYYRYATLSIGVGALILLFVVMGAMLAANENKMRGRINVDARGTVIIPDEVDFSSEFGRTPGGGRCEPAADASTNERAEREAVVAASHGLRQLYIDVIKQIHPDHASSEADRVLRERLTKDANAAFKKADDAALRRILAEFESSAPQN
jgi:hypothetical protein